MKPVNSEDSGLTVAGADIPAAMSSLIDGAVAAFDADRNSSRRYLMRASALLRATCPPKDSRHALPRGALATWRMNRVIDYIDSHLAERITVRDLADLVNLSLGQMFSAFKVSVGTSPMNYIARRRFVLACETLKTTREPLSQIAVACGFCDQSHLCRLFRRMTGMSPAVWRRAHQRADDSSPPHTVEFAGDQTDRTPSTSCDSVGGLSALRALPRLGRE